MREITEHESYLGYAMTNISRTDADEMLLLTRRIQYLTAKYDDFDDADEVISNLIDVDEDSKVLEQLNKIYKDRK